MATASKRRLKRQDSAKKRVHRAKIRDRELPSNLNRTANLIGMAARSKLNGGAI